MSNQLNFVALDVETANADMASICQIGIAKYIDGVLVEEWSSLINPEDYFDFINVDIHGITESDVVDSPTFPEIVSTLNQFLNNTICVSHTHFDRISIGRALAKYNLKEIETVWLDSARVARRTWEDCAWSGYGLPIYAKRSGIYSSIMMHLKMQRLLVKFYLPPLRRLELILMLG